MQKSHAKCASFKIYVEGNVCFSLILIHISHNNSLLLCFYFDCIPDLISNDWLDSNKIKTINNSNINVEKTINHHSAVLDSNNLQKWHHNNSFLFFLIHFLGKKTLTTKLIVNCMNQHKKKYDEWHNTFNIQHIKSTLFGREIPGIDFGSYMYRYMYVSKKKSLSSCLSVKKVLLFCFSTSFTWDNIFTLTLSRKIH